MRWLVWFKWLIFITCSGQLLVSLGQSHKKCFKKCILAMSLSLLIMEELDQVRKQNYTRFCNILSLSICPRICIVFVNPQAGVCSQNVLSWRSLYPSAQNLAISTCPLLSVSREIVSPHGRLAFSPSMTEEGVSQQQQHCKVCIKILIAELKCFALSSHIFFLCFSA